MSAAASRDPAGSDDIGSVHGIRRRLQAGEATMLLLLRATRK